MATIPKQPKRKFRKACPVCTQPIMSNEDYWLKNGVAYHKACDPDKKKKAE